MKYPPLTTAILLKRYKRFLADVRLPSGKIICVHVPNTGKMTTCWQAGDTVKLRHYPNPSRKYPYGLELIQHNNTWININTQLANKLVIEAIHNGIIRELQHYTKITAEKKYGKSRIDLYLEGHGQNCFVEIKNVTLNLGGIAQFPDTISTRGTKHLQDLIRCQEEGARAIILFLVGRRDVNSFAPAYEIDATYSATLLQAVDQGVEVLIYQCLVTPQEIKITNSLPWK